MGIEQPLEIVPIKFDDDIPQEFVKSTSVGRITLAAELFGHAYVTSSYSTIVCPGILGRELADKQALECLELFCKKPSVTDRLTATLVKDGVADTASFELGSLAVENDDLRQQISSEAVQLARFDLHEAGKLFSLICNWSQLELAIKLPRHAAFSQGVLVWLAKKHAAWEKPTIDWSESVKRINDFILLERARIGLDEFNIFVSYSHKDEEICSDIERRLAALTPGNVTMKWMDRKILPGIGWKREIDRDLENADLILFLLSSDLLESRYFREVELRQAMSRHKSGDAVVLPIILSSCEWKSSPLRILKALPYGGTPVTGATGYSIDDALSDVAIGIQRAMKQLRMAPEHPKRGGQHRRAGRRKAD